MFSYGSSCTVKNSREPTTRAALLAPSLFSEQLGTDPKMMSPSRQLVFKRTPPRSLMTRQRPAKSFRHGAAASVGAIALLAAPASAPASPNLPPLRAHQWMIAACRREAAVLHGKPFLCPVKGPTQLKPTENTYVMGLGPIGFVFEGGVFGANGQTGHWLFFGFDTRGQVETYGSLGERLGATTVRGHPAAWWRNYGTGGIFEGHLTLVWHEGGRIYGISDHIGYPFNATPVPGAGTNRVRESIRSIAIEGMNWFRRRHLTSGAARSREPIYLVQGRVSKLGWRGKLRPVARSAATTPRTAIIDLLLGPIQAEQKRGLKTAIPQHARLMSLSVMHGTAVVSLKVRDATPPSSRALPWMRLGGDDFYGTAQIVYTLTRFNSVRRVLLFVNGNHCCISTMREGLVRKPLTRAFFVGWQGTP